MEAIGYLILGVFILAMLKSIFGSLHEMYCTVFDRQRLEQIENDRYALREAYAPWLLVGGLCIFFSPILAFIILVVGYPVAFLSRK